MRVLFLILIFFSSLFSKDLEATYRVSFGIFGQIGIAKTSLHIEGGEYKITVYAKSTGFASLISGNRQEWYESQGVVKDGFFLPNLYRKVVQKEVSVDSSFGEESKMEIKRYELLYRFDHKHKEVTATKIKSRGESRSEHSEKLKFYSKNDLLSLFFNFKKFFPTLKIDKHHTLYAVGAEKNTGKIDLYPLKRSEFARLVDGDLDSLRLMKVILSDKIFASKKGELYLGFDKEGFCKKAVLKDVILFGDIRGELIEKNY